MPSVPNSFCVIENPGSKAVHHIKRQPSPHPPRRYATRQAKRRAAVWAHASGSCPLRAAQHGVRPPALPGRFPRCCVPPVCAGRICARPKPGTGRPKADFNCGRRRKNGQRNFRLCADEQAHSGIQNEPIPRDSGMRQLIDARIEKIRDTAHDSRRIGIEFLRLPEPLNGMHDDQFSPARWRGRDRAKHR